MVTGSGLKEHCSSPGKQMDQMSGVQSAQRTMYRPAIHRWVTFAKRGLKPVKRAAEIAHVARAQTCRLSPALRAPEFLLVPLPSTKVLGYCRSSASRTNNLTWVRAAALFLPHNSADPCQFLSAANRPCKQTAQAARATNRNARAARKQLAESQTGYR